MPNTTSFPIRNLIWPQLSPLLLSPQPPSSLNTEKNARVEAVLISSAALHPLLAIKIGRPTVKSTTDQQQPQLLSAIPSFPSHNSSPAPLWCLPMHRREIKSKFASPLRSARALSFNLHFICTALAYNIVEMPRTLPPPPTPPAFLHPRIPGCLWTRANDRGTCILES